MAELLIILGVPAVIAVMALAFVVVVGTVGTVEIHPGAGRRDKGS